MVLVGCGLVFISGGQQAGSACSTNQINHSADCFQYCTWGMHTGSDPHLVRLACETSEQ